LIIISKELTNKFNSTTNYLFLVYYFIKFKFILFFQQKIVELQKLFRGFLDENLFIPLSEKPKFETEDVGCMHIEREKDYTKY